MKSVIAICTIFITTFAAAAPQDAKPKIENLAWLAGCWESSSATKTSGERWTKPAGKMMMATAQTIKNDKTVSFEFLRIVENDLGIFYIAKPSQNTSETSFKLVKWGESEAVFENPEHDFPQRVIYRLEKDKSLFARVEGKNNGKEMGIDFPMKRLACE